MIFIGNTTKDAMSYAPGEEIVFRIKPQDGTVPYLSYSLEGDDGKCSDGFVQPEADGWFFIRTSVDCAGFVHLLARACGEDKQPLDGYDAFEGGAGAAVDTITTGTEVPDDYLDFWADLKAQAEAIEPEVIFEQRFDPQSDPKYSPLEPTDGFVCYEIYLRVKDDMYAACVVSYPKDAQPGTLKLVTMYRGYGVNPAVTRAIPGAMTVTVSAHSMKNFEPRAYYDELGNGPLKEYGFDHQQNERPETTYWAQVFLRHFVALKHFRHHPLLNGKDYIFTGGSQGGMQACNMAAHSGLATACVMVVPWMADLGGARLHRMPGWRPDYQNGMRYFDTAVAGMHLRCPATILAGLGDYVCPPSGMMALYNGIPTSKKLVMLQNMTHGYRPLDRVGCVLGEEDLQLSTQVTIPTDRLWESI